MKLRVKFTKNGCLKFIGHLDIMRYFQKAVRRAGIDVAYSEGFSPHQIMSFAAPLGVGMTSDGEYFDMEVHSVTSSEDMMLRLNRVMAEGITVSDIRLLSDRAGNAMASVAAASYIVCLRKGHTCSFSWKEAADRFCAAEHAPFLKKTEKSEIELDLKRSVYELKIPDHAMPEICSGSISEGADPEHMRLSMLVDASSSGNIKPSMVMEVLYGYYGQSPAPFDLMIHRTETYLRAEDGSLLPLSSAGEVF